MAEIELVKKVVEKTSQTTYELAGWGVALFLFLLLAIMVLTYHRKWRIIRKQDKLIIYLNKVIELQKEEIYLLKRKKK